MSSHRTGAVEHRWAAWLGSPEFSVELRPNLFSAEGGMMMRVDGSRWSMMLACALGFGCAGQDGARFGPVVTVAERDGNDPTVAVDRRTGSTYLVWATGATNGSRNVLFTAVTADGAVGQPAVVNRVRDEVMSTKESPPQIAVGDDGTIYVGWIAAERGSAGAIPTRHLRVARSTDGGRTFQPPVTLGEIPGRATTLMYYDIAAGSDKTVLASWLDLWFYAASLAKPHHDTAPAAAGAAPKTEPSQPIEEAEFRFARSEDGGVSFGPPATLDTLACICCRTAVAAGADGAAYLMWRHVFPGGERDFALAVRGGRSNDPPPVRVHEDHWRINACPDIGPDVAVDSAGRIHAAWFTGVDGRRGLHYTSSSDQGRTFGPARPILVGPQVPTSQVKIATSGATPWLVWEDKTAAKNKVRLGWVDAAGEIREVPGEVGTGERPAIAAGQQRVSIAWVDGGAIRLRVGLTTTRGG